MAADEQLEAVGELRVRLELLGKRADLERVLGDEGGLDDVVLDQGLEELGDELALAPGVLDLDAMPLGQRDELVAAAAEGDVFAGGLGGELDHGRAAEGLLEVDDVALVGALKRAVGSLACGAEGALAKVHHAAQVGVGAVCLEGGELGVVGEIHALVAEAAVHLEDALEAAHEQALEVELGRNAQVDLGVEGVEVRGEGLGRGTAHDGVQHGGLDLEVALVLAEAAQSRGDLEALGEGVFDLGVHDEVDVALAVAGLLVCQAVELLRQGAQGLGQQGHLLG